MRAISNGLRACLRYLLNNTRMAGMVDCSCRLAAPAHPSTLFPSTGLHVFTHAWEHREILVNSIHARKGQRPQAALASQTKQTVIITCNHHPKTHRTRSSSSSNQMSLHAYASKQIVSLPWRRSRRPCELAHDRPTNQQTSRHSAAHHGK